MAYATSNPPSVFKQLGAAGRNLWFYGSPDAASVVDASGYFSNGTDLGMKDKDLIWVMDTDTGLTTMHIVLVAAGVVDLTDGTAVTTATNSD